MLKLYEKDLFNVYRNKRIDNSTTNKYSKKGLLYVPYFINYDPFIIENSVIIIQRKWRLEIILRKNRYIKKNIHKIINYTDPISRELLIDDNNLVVNINLLFFIERNNFLYIYKLESLLNIIDYNCIEAITNTKLSSYEVKNIRLVLNLLKLNFHNETFTEKEDNYFKKIEILQKLDILGSYFSIDLYNRISNENKIKVYNELKSMWLAFFNDNNLKKLKKFNKIKWIAVNIENIDTQLLYKIDTLLNKDIEINLKKMISYLIVGAFAYVVPEIKKIYNNFDFI